MPAGSKIVYEITKDGLKNVIDEVVRDKESTVFDRYYNVFVDAKTVAKIHNVSEPTIIRYIKEGFIKPEPDSGRVHKFRLSEVLKMDFSKFKYKRNYAR